MAELRVKGDEIHLTLEEAVELALSRLILPEIGHLLAQARRPAKRAALEPPGSPRSPGSPRQAT